MENLLMKRLQNIYKQTEKLDLMLVMANGAICSRSSRGLNVSEEYAFMSNLEQVKCDIRQELREIAVNQMGVDYVIERLCNTIEGREG